MTSFRRLALVFLCLGLMALGAVAIGLSVGSVKMSFADVMTGLFDPAAPGAVVIRDLRLPRTLAAFGCGGLLALAGALMQVLLRNPLADPYVLGVSGGAGVGALLAIFFGWSVLWVDTLAFAGALSAMLLVFGLSHGDGSWTQTRLLLPGVIVASGCGALIALMLAMAPETKLRGMLFWLMGDLGQSTTWWPAMLALVVAVAATRLRYAVFLIASLATAAAVTTAGSVGFIGLVVPHLVRLATGNDQRLLLPASLLAGGSLLVLADTLARTLIAPQQLPVGVLTALVGVPVFLFLLSRQPK